MNWQSIVLLLIIAAAVITALIFIRKNKGSCSGCSGNCNGCSGCGLSDRKPD